MREISKSQFGKKQISIACYFKWTHFCSSNFDDRYGCFGNLREYGLLQFFGEGEVGSLIVTRAPSMLLAVGADLNYDLHERNLLCLDII